MRCFLSQRAPAVELLQQPGQRTARLGLQLIGFDQHFRGAVERTFRNAGEMMHELQSGVAQAAPWQIDDALESKIVITLP